MRPFGTALIVAACAAGLSCSLLIDADGLTGAGRGTGDASDAGVDAAGLDDAKVPLRGWKFRKPLTVAAASVAGTSDLVGFPLLVSATDPDLRSTDKGGKVETGRDLAFFAADGVTPVAYEIEQYSRADGHLIAWVLLPALSPTNGVKLYLAFGNPDVTVSLEDRRAVWNNGYAGVWHMGDSAWTDSAGSNKGTPAGGPSIAQNGVIGAAGSFGPTDVNVDVGTDPGLRPTSITVSAWMQPQSVGSAPDRHPYMIRQDSWRAAGSDPRGYYMEIYRTQTDPRPTFYTANATAMAHAFATTNVVNGRWYYVVGTRDEASGVTRIYVNGVQEGSATMTGAVAYQPNPVLIGGFGTETWGGLLDEVRISRVARTSEWIKTEYDNQLDPQRFVQVGALESVP